LLAERSDELVRKGLGWEGGATLTFEFDGVTFALETVSETMDVEPSGVAVSGVACTRDT
jgi:hypothetical protein